MAGTTLEKPEARETTRGEREERAAGRAVLCIFGVLFLTWGAYLGVAVALLLGQEPWLKEHLNPVDKPLALFCGYWLVPLCLLLALFRRTRLLSGMAFFLVSGVFTFVTCAASAVYVYDHGHWWAMVLGTLLVGYGIIPTALVCAGTQHQWNIAGQLAGGAIMLFSCLYLGLTLMTLSFSSNRMLPPAPED